MDQKKTGNFLKELRKEKGFTQEQVAEKLGVSARTISRWETAAYMPDISMLVDIAEMYDVDVREIIDGERRKENMNSEVKEVAEKMADYSAMEKKNMLKWIRFMSISIIIVTVCIIILNIVNAFGQVKYAGLPALQSTLVVGSAFLGADSILCYVLLAFSVGITIYAEGKFSRIMQSRAGSGAVKVFVGIAVVMAIIAGVEALLYTSHLYSALQAIK